MPLSLVRMSPHRIVQTIRARNSVTVSAYSLAAATAMYVESISELERWLPESEPDRGSSLARGPTDGDPGQRPSEEGESRPSSRARVTASARLCTPSLVYALRKWVLIVFSDTNSSAAISGAGRLVGR